MATLLALPEEILEVILHYLVCSKLEDTPGAECRTRIATQTASELRLVCRTWAAWLFGHIYRRLTFSSDFRMLDFLDQIVQPGWIRNAACQNLVIRGLWHNRLGGRSRDGRRLASFGAAKSLLGFFSDSIVELDLEFVDSFGFQAQTIEVIGALKNLRVLRLGLQFDRLSMVSTAGNISSRWPVENFEPESLRALLGVARELVTLDLTSLPLSVLPVFEPYGGADRLAKIRQLDIKLVSDQPLESLVSLCIALRGSLKVLSIQSFRNDLQQLLPAFHCLKDTLEGLFLSDESALHQILDLNFPKLRVFRIHYWDDCISQLLNRDMFAFAPLEVVAVYSHTVYRRKRKFVSDPFQRLAHLKRFVFLHARLDDEPPVTYMNACKAHQIECVFLSQGAISEVMKL